MKIRLEITPTILCQHSKRLISSLIHITFMLKWIANDGEIKQVLLGDIKELAMRAKIYEKVIESWVE